MMKRREFLTATTALVGAGLPLFARSQADAAPRVRISAQSGTSAAGGSGDITVQTTTGPIKAADMGRTLVHEHIFCALPGWEFDHRQPKFDRKKSMSRVVDILQELQHYGCRTVVDPLPMDMGRDVEFVAEASQRSGTRIICATGFYNEQFGHLWTVRWLSKEQLLELYVKELTAGVGDTGIRCGAIKIATTGVPTEYERKMISIASEASRIAGVPIISHTDCTHGVDQIDLVEGGGVPANCLVVGHSGDRDDHEYQKSIAVRGAFVGLDRFGFKHGIPQSARIQNLMQLVEAGQRDRVVVSHDCVLCMRGNFPPPSDVADMADISFFMRDVAPQLLKMGLSKEDLERILVDNPRALFTNAAKQVTRAGAGQKSAAG